MWECFRNVIGTGSEEEDFMGAWGPKLYQDDIAEEVRHYYKDQLHRGKRGKEITQELIEQYEYAISDQDDAPVFWFALADSQWNLGRLEDEVKRQALDHIHNGYDLNRWKAEDPKEAKIREKVLRDLEEKLLSPQPAEKKISQYKLYHCEWEIGDVYAYRLGSDYAKEKGMLEKYLYFVKVDERIWHPGHTVPTVYFYWVIGDKLLSLEELKNVDYIPQFFTPKAYENNKGRKMLYRLTLLSTSSRVIPKKQLTFIGNIKDVKHVENEDPDSFQVSWRDFEKYILKNFENWKEFAPHY